MVESDCPKCGLEDVEIEDWSSGECPRCGNKYYCYDDSYEDEDGDLDYYMFVEWEERQNL